MVCSQLIERKKIDGILEKFAKYLDQYNSTCQLFIIGEGELKEKLQRMAQTLGIAPNVIFTGKMTHDELLPILSKSKALLVNTVKDNNMISIVEAIAVGTPIVTTDVPLNSTYIKEYQLGIAKKQWDESDLNDVVSKDKDKKDVFSVGILYILFAIIIFSSAFICNKYVGALNIFVDYTGIVILMFSSNILYDYLSQYCRGIEKITDIAIAGIISSVTLLGSNIIFLLLIKAGLEGYMFAYCLSNIIPSFYLILKLKLWSYWRNPNNKRNLQKEMTDYSKPLVVDTISWWINNASDRYIVMAFCGASITGIYSVSYKIPSLLNLFQNIFNQAWLLSAVKENDETRTTDFYENVYKIYNTGMTVVCSGLLVFNKLIAKILFANDFYNAWKFAPFLMISVVFGGMCGLLGGMFAAVKQSRINAMSSFSGACINVMLNIPLTFFFNALGASFATLMSYFTVWLIRLYKSYKLFEFTVEIKKDALNYFVLLLQAVVQIAGLSLLRETFIEIILFVLVLYFSRNNFMLLLNKLLKR